MVEIGTKRVMRIALIAVILLIVVAAGAWMLLGSQSKQTATESQNVQPGANETQIVAAPPTQTNNQTNNQTSSLGGVTCSAMIQGAPKDNYTYRLTTDEGTFTVESDFIRDVDRIDMGDVAPPFLNVTARKTVITETVSGPNTPHPTVTEYDLLDNRLTCYEVVLVVNGAGTLMPCTDFTQNYTTFRYCVDDLYNKTDTSVNVPLGTFSAEQCTLADGSMVWFNDLVSVPLKIESTGSVSELMNYSRG